MTEYRRGWRPQKGHYYTFYLDAGHCFKGKVTQTGEVCCIEEVTQYGHVSEVVFNSQDIIALRKFGEESNE